MVSLWRVGKWCIRPQMRSFSAGGKTPSRLRFLWSHSVRFSDGCSSSHSWGRPFIIGHLSLIPIRTNLQQSLTPSPPGLLVSLIPCRIERQLLHLPNNLAQSLSGCRTVHTGRPDPCPEEENKRRLDRRQAMQERVEKLQQRVSLTKTHLQERARQGGQQ